MTVSRDRVIRVSDAWPVLGVGIFTYACSSCCAGVRLDRDAAERSILVYPDILEECRSEAECPNTVSGTGSRVGVVTTDMRCRDRRTHARCRLQSYNDI
jgi:hypothetical protein